MNEVKKDEGWRGSVEGNVKGGAQIRPKQAAN